MPGTCRGFDEIRKIQDFILERAEKEGTLVVDNVNIDDTVGMVVDALYGVIEQTRCSAGERLRGAASARVSRS